MGFAQESLKGYLRVSDVFSLVDFSTFLDGGHYLIFQRDSRLVIYDTLFIPRPRFLPQLAEFPYYWSLQALTPPDDKGMDIAFFVFPPDGPWMVGQAIPRRLIRYHVDFEHSLNSHIVSASAQLFYGTADFHYADKTFTIVQEDGSLIVYPEERMSLPEPLSNAISFDEDNALVRTMMGSYTLDEPWDFASKRQVWGTHLSDQRLLYLLNDGEEPVFRAVLYELGAREATLKGSLILPPSKSATQPPFIYESEEEYAFLFPDMIIVVSAKGLRVVAAHVVPGLNACISHADELLTYSSSSKGNEFRFFVGDQLSVIPTEEDFTSFDFSARYLVGVGLPSDTLERYDRQRKLWAHLPLPALENEDTDEAASLLFWGSHLLFLRGHFLRLLDAETLQEEDILSLNGKETPELIIRGEQLILAGQGRRGSNLSISLLPGKKS